MSDIFSEAKIMKFIRVMSAFLCAAIVCTLLSACSGKKKDALQLEFSIKTKNDLSQATVNGDYAKIDLVKSGLDAASIETVMYSLSDNKETGRVNLGEGVWKTGSLDNGFFAVDEANRSVRFFDFHGKETFSHEVETSAEFFGTSYVSADGKYLVYHNPQTREVCMYEFSNGKTYVTGKASGKVEAYGYSDGWFYIQVGATCMLKVSVKDKQLITAFDSDILNFVTKDGGTGSGEDMQIPYVDACQVEKTKKITYRSVDEVVVDIIPSGVVTLSVNADDYILRLYDHETNALREINIGNEFVSSTDAGKNKLLVCMKNEKGFLYKLYDLENIEQKTVEEFTSAADIPPAEDGAKVSDITVLPESGESSHFIKDVPLIAQNPDYPTGCESVCAVMALKYMKHNVTINEFVDDYLQKNDEFTYVNGENYGPDPKEYFIGNPRFLGGYGCFAPVIKNAIAKALNDDKAVVDATGIELKNICSKYVANDIPVIIWVTISMIDTYPSARWTLQNGEQFCWPANEHCMLLVGYDDEYYYLNDPYSGENVKYSKELTEQRYAQLSKQAVAVIK